jgi:hypothetical protein
MYNTKYRHFTLILLSDRRDIRRPEQLTVHPSVIKVCNPESIFKRLKKIGISRGKRFFFLNTPHGPTLFISSNIHTNLYWSNLFLKYLVNGLYTKKKLITIQKLNPITVHTRPRLTIRSFLAATVFSTTIFFPSAEVNESGRSSNFLVLFCRSP